MQVIGLDGFKERWVVVTLEDGRFLSAGLAASVAEAAASFRGASVIGVDIPIGLPERHGRDADRAAQAFIGPRRNSVFMTLPRAVLEAPTHEAAILLSQELTGQGISAQSYALRAKILETEKAALADARIIEVHPEVSFAAMAEGHLAHSKKRWAGLMRRRALLRAAGVEVPEEIGEAGIAGPDDVLDAAAAAWTAHRKARGLARALPRLPDQAESRLPGVIWY